MQTSSRARASTSTISRFAACLLGQIILLLTAAIATSQPPEAGLEPAPQDKADGIRYTVTFEGRSPGDLNDELRNYLASVSQLATSMDRPQSPSLYLLRARVEEDTEHLRIALRARALYGASVSFEIMGEEQPARIVYTIHPGEPYPLTSFDLELASSSEVERPTPDALALPLGQPALAEPISALEDKLPAYYASRGHPFPEFQGSRVVVNHNERTVSVTARLDPGPFARFGQTTIHGLEHVNEDYARHKIPWVTGQPYSTEEIANYQEALIKTGLFSLVQVETDRTVGQDGLLPIRVQVTERLRRSVRAGVSYRTDEGVGVTTSWEHRNLFGGAEDLEIALQVATLVRSLTASFRKPEFLREDQTFLARVRLADEDTDAYRSRGVSSSAVVDRNLTPKLVVGTGIGVDSAEVTEQSDEVDNKTETYNLFSLPSHLDWNNRNDLLNPTAGQALSLQVIPFMDLETAELAFVRDMVSLVGYQRISSEPSVILAGRSSVGAIQGSSRSFVPADRRFYAGGGGSIRGYPYQSVGPLDEDDDPIGGRSLLEVSGELRYRLTEDVGLVVFLDGGNAFTSEVPDFSRILRWGTGLGLRYFTPIGPVRVDVAFPLNPRPDIDDALQFYVSLGQAF